MHNPPHPGALVREDVLAAGGLTVTAAADILAMSRSNLSLFLNERIDLSREMALELEAAFGLEAEVLMAMRIDHDLAPRATVRDHREGPPAWTSTRMKPGRTARPKAFGTGFGVAAVQAGIPLNLVQRWLGHAQLSTTVIYAEAVGAEEQSIAVRMW